MVTSKQFYEMVLANDLPNVEHFAHTVPRNDFVRTYPNIVAKAPIDTIPHLLRNNLVLLHAYRGGWYDAVKSEADVEKLLGLELPRERVPLCFIIINKKFSEKLLVEAVRAGFPVVIRGHSLLSLLCHKDNYRYTEAIYKDLPMDPRGTYLIDELTKQLAHISFFTFGFIALWQKVLTHTIHNCPGYNITRLLIQFLEMQNFELNYIYDNVCTYLLEIAHIDYDQLIAHFSNSDYSKEYTIYRLLAVTNYKSLLVDKLRGTKWNSLQKDVSILFDE